MPPVTPAHRGDAPYEFGRNHPRRPTQIGHYLGALSHDRARQPADAATIWSRQYRHGMALPSSRTTIRRGNFGWMLVISSHAATLRPYEGAAAMPKGNREAKKPKKEKPKTTAAVASAKGTGSGPKK